MYNRLYCILTEYVPLNHKIAMYNRLYCILTEYVPFKS